MKFAVKDVNANPFRNLKLHPLVEEKVLALMESMQATGVWPNLIGRLNEDGKPEIAYGHTRLEAMRRLKISHVEITIEKRTDAEMLAIMSRENNEVYGSDLGAVIESVRATVQALANGILTHKNVPLDKEDSRYTRYAPSFIVGKKPKDGGKFPPYSPASLALFLGSTSTSGGGKIRASEKIEAALATLERIEAGIWDMKRLDTFRKEDGSIPVNTVLKQAKLDAEQAAVKKAREDAKARAVAEAHKASDERWKEIQRADKADADRKDREALEAAKKQRQEKTARREEEARLAAEAAEAAREKIEEAKRLWEEEKSFREREAQREAERAERAAVKAAANKEANRSARMKTLREKVNIILTNEDPLLKEILGARVDFRENDKGLLVKAMGEAAERFEKLLKKL